MYRMDLIYQFLIELCVNALVDQTKLKIPARFTKIPVKPIFFVLTCIGHANHL